jgi:hypothetical protein
MKRTALVAVIAFGGCIPAAVSPGPPPPPPAVNLQRADTLDPQPPWNYESLRAGALAAIAPLMGHYGRDRPPVGTIQGMRVLTWHVREDTAQNLRIERALLWLQLRGDPTIWALANLYRHPGVDTTWRPATATHTQYFGGRLYVDRPTNADIYALLDIAQNWLFQEDPRVPFIAADVRERTWLAVVGREPVRFYVPPDPDPDPDPHPDPDPDPHPDPDPDPDPEDDGEDPRVLFE